ncbi:MAG: hypothetical protein ACO3L6_03175 [Dehalococcoidia bacterium]
MFPITGDISEEIIPIDSAPFTCVRVQPKSSSSGMMNRLNVNWTVPSTAPIDSAETAAMYQPRYIPVF